jgi:hypothetical protein
VELVERSGKTVGMREMSVRDGGVAEVVGTGIEEEEAKRLVARKIKVANGTDVSGDSEGEKAPGMGREVTRDGWGVAIRSGVELSMDPEGVKRVDEGDGRRLGASSARSSGG